MRGYQSLTHPPPEHFETTRSATWNWLRLQVQDNASPAAVRASTATLIARAMGAIQLSRWDADAREPKMLRTRHV